MNCVADVAPAATGVGAASCSREPSMEQALATAMGDLHGCRTRLERLRAENRIGVPLGEVECWCASITSQFSSFHDKLQAKFETCRSKVRARDETIRRLHRQVQELSSLNSAPACSSQAASDRTPAVPLVTGAVGWPHSRTSTAPLVSSPPDGVEDAPILGTTRSGLRLNASPSGRAGSNGDEEKTASGPSRPRNKAGPSSVDPALQKVAARRGTTDAYALERAQHAQLRRENAQLRRGQVEVVGQLRARDAQVEQLTAMIRELVAQRQIGVYKRQLHLQDSALFALQEDVLLDRNAHPAATASSTQPNGDQPRAARGARPVGGTSASGPSLLAASGNDRRTSRGGAAMGSRSFGSGSADAGALSEMRGRGGGSSGVGLGSVAALRRERSVSAQPYTPRGKLRDVVGHPTRVAVETPGARSSGRTTSTAKVGRSTSVEDRTARRAREGMPNARRR